MFRFRYYYFYFIFLFQLFWSGNAGEISPTFVDMFYFSGIVVVIFLSFSLVSLVARRPARCAPALPGGSDDQPRACWRRYGRGLAVPGWSWPDDFSRRPQA